MAEERVKCIEYPGSRCPEECPLYSWAVDVKKQSSVLGIDHMKETRLPAGLSPQDIAVHGYRWVIIEQGLTTPCFNEQLNKEIKK